MILSSFGVLPRVFNVTCTIQLLFYRRRCRLALVRLDRPTEARPALERALGLLDASPYASTAANLRQSIRQLQSQCEEEMTGA